MKKYEIIFKDLQDKIKKQHYPVDQYLPSELTLTKTYSASRDTIRKALRLLNEAGLVESTQGVGTKVIHRQQIQFPISELTSYQELVQHLGMPSKTRVISLDKVILDDKQAQTTGFTNKAIVWRITRQRQVDGVASVLDIDYLDKQLVPNINKDIAQYSIYAYLEHMLKLDIAYAQKEITIEQVTATDQIYLDLHGDQHVVSVKSKVFLADGQQFQFTESRHKLDKFKFVDFAKRKK
ncbi:trehalose operon repressor [Streptococcus sp. sy010]|uniref:trehalose operon repressor n=1 Tax=Streptococcus sp. sy010 TaxID=2600148 RepID=UPI0011B4F116|nr:trehalose operon repressor [Streptococcus sp. sy010]TWT14647.1 trehalose operon repressor [Streptococcus sp. sy010]